MKFYLMRHGHAMQPSFDSQRPLSQRGRAEVLSAAERLKKKQVAVDVIWHSSKLRALQTAEIIADFLGVPKEKVQKKKGLEPDDSPDLILNEILALSAEKDTTQMMVVSHLPLLPHLLDTLLKGASQKEKAVSFHEAGLVCLDSQSHGEWRLEWVL